MIQWKAVAPDLKAADLAEVLSRLSFVDAISITSVLLRGPLVLFSAEAKEAVLAHVRGRREESGGLLLGSAVLPSNTTSAIASPIVFISKAVPSHEFHGTSVSLQMGPSVWESARKEAGLLVVGWFHSHPNLGAFFSGTDRKTQREFFSHEYSIGYVVDPVRNDHAFFLGQDSAQVSDAQVLDVPMGKDLGATLRRG